MLRLPSRAPGQHRRNPAASPIHRELGLVPGGLIQRMNPFTYVQMLDNLGVDNDGMVSMSTECAETCRRWGRAARAQIERERIAAWHKHCLRRWRPCRPCVRARRHRVARRTTAKATADPDGPETRTPLAHDPREAP